MTEPGARQEFERAAEQGDRIAVLRKILGNHPQQGQAAVPVPPERKATVTIMPKGEVFENIQADPRWARFSASWLNYGGHESLDNVGATKFGGRFPFFGGETPAGKSWRMGIQTGVFSIFNLDGNSKDLLNTDFWVAWYTSYRQGPYSVLARIFHQSSHLGDEFLLDNRDIERINLSVNGLDVLLSRDLQEGTYRIYGGGGGFFYSDPSDFDPWKVQYGAEFRSSRRYTNGWVQPLAAVDIQHLDDTDWEASISVQAGIELENPRHPGKTYQFLLEYYNGNSPNGQFYIETIDYLGVGFHVFF